MAEQEKRVMDLGVIGRVCTTVEPIAIHRETYRRRKVVAARILDVCARFREGQRAETYN